MCPMWLKCSCGGLAKISFLATKDNLFRRAVVPNKLCPICELEEEIVEHILWSCPSAKDVWGSGSISLQKGECIGRNFLQVCEEMMTRCDKTDFELFGVAARNIWLCRNSVVHAGEF